VAKVEYKRWLSRAEPGAEELAAMAKQVAGFRYLPRFSLALVVDDADEIWIKSTAESVLNQVYPHLELCVCDNGSVRPHVRETLEEHAVADGRVKLLRLPEEEDFAEARNATLSLASGEFVGLLDPGDRLAPAALFGVAELLQRVEADAVYTDEDLIDVTDEHYNPRFKPYWSPDLLLGTPYVGRLCVMRKSLVDDLGSMREGFEGAEEHDLILRLSEKTSRIRHLPGVLYHRRTLPGHAESSSEVRSRGAVEDALRRRGEDASVEPVRGSLRINRRVDEPGVSIMVHVPPGTSAAPLLEHLEHEARHPGRELILVGGDREAYPSVDLHVDHPFPARALNLAAGKAGGEYLAFVNGRAEEISAGWIPELLGEARREGVGVAGGKVLAPNGGVRHGGSVIEAGWLAGRLEEPVSEDEDYLPPINRRFNPAAASVAFMMVRRESFEGVGGFDDDNLLSAFYDLDLSFRLREKGLLNIYTPHASIVLGVPVPVPDKAEIAYMWRRWWAEQVRMLFYRRSPLYTEHRGLDVETLALISA
jgi:hypothetical protein